MERQVRMCGIPSLPAAARLDLAAGRGVRGWLPIRRPPSPIAPMGRSEVSALTRTPPLTVAGTAAYMVAGKHLRREAGTVGSVSRRCPIFVWQWLPSLRGDC